MMEEGRTYSNERTVYLNRLKPPEDRQPGPITDKELRDLTLKGIIRSSHYLWLAEQYMIDMCKLGNAGEFEDNLVALSGICRYMEDVLSKILAPGAHRRH